MARLSPRRRLPDRLDLTFPGIGRLHKAHGADSLAEYDRRVGLLQELYISGGRDGWAALQAIREGRFSITTIVAAARAGRLRDLWADLLLQQPLAGAVDAWLARAAPAKPRTHQRYRVSWTSLQHAGVLREGAVVADLGRIDWPVLERTWSGGKHDWKHLRGFVSRFLSVQLGTDHPFRRELLARFPRPGKIRGRVPDLTPAAFWRAVQAMPEHVRAAPVAIVATGMRIGEFCACTSDHLLPLTKQLRIPGTKTPASADVLPIDPQLWAWVKRAIPCPVGHWRLRELWRRACAAAGITGVTIHDLRHCNGQWLVAAGQPLTAVQKSLRHTSDAMTRQYVEQIEKGENARVIAQILIAAATPGSTPTAKRAKGRNR